MMSHDSSPASDLRALTTAERELCARYPMEAHIPDAVVNKTLLCDALDVSPTTLSAWIRAGLPYESAGTNGRSYEFRLSLAYAWFRERKNREDASRKHAEGAAQQLRLELIGDDSEEAAARARLSPREQQEQYKAEQLWMMAQATRRELIRRADVTNGIAEVWAGLRDRLDALPDMLARRLDLSGAEIEAAEAVCHGLLSDAVEVVRGIIGDDEERGTL